MDNDTKKGVKTQMRRLLSGVLVLSVVLGLVAGSNADAALAAAISCRSCPNPNLIEAISSRTLSPAERGEHMAEALSNSGFTALKDELARSGYEVSLRVFRVYSLKNTESVGALGVEFSGGLLLYGMVEDKSVVYLSDRKEIWGYDDAQGIRKVRILEVIRPKLVDPSLTTLGDDACMLECVAAWAAGCYVLCAMFGLSPVGLLCSLVCALGASGSCDCVCNHVGCPPYPPGEPYPWE